MVSKFQLINLCTILLVSLEGSCSRVSTPVGQQLARRIMGENFLGPREVFQHFGIRLTDKELAKAHNIPFSQTTLLQCRDSHILFFGVKHDRNGKPLTIHRLREMFPAQAQPRFRSYPESARSGENYATKETPHLRWYLVSKSLRQETRSKPYWQQELFLKQNQYRERAVVYIYMMLLVFKARGQRLFQKDLIWCHDAGSDGAPVAAGYFDRDGIYVSDWWLRPDHHFGSAPARKPDFP